MLVAATEGDAQRLMEKMAKEGDTALGK